MARIVISRSIDAPLDIVFNTVADVREMSKALPHVVKFEFLSEIKSGIGTRFRETRLMNGKEAKTELDLTEFVPDKRVRLVADDKHGTVWATLFTVDSERGKTLLTITMDANSYKWLAGVFVFFIMGMVKRAVERDMDLVKGYCERLSRDHAGTS